MNNYYYIAFSGMVQKEITRFVRIWPQTLLPSVMTTVLYLLVFGNVMGQHVGMVHGFRYTTFITPGLVLLAMITNAYNNVVSSFYGARFNRSIEELLTSPVPPWMIIMGYASGGVIRGLLIGVLVSAVGLFFEWFTPVHIGLSIVLACLCSFLFALAGLLNGIFAKKFDDLVIVPTFILTPLIYLGGVFFDIKDLGSFWQMVSYGNPVRYLIDSFRLAWLGLPPTEPLWIALCGIVACIMLLYTSVWYCLHKGIGLKN
jgi:ABC-2 type transport system permease protein